MSNYDLQWPSAATFESGNGQYLYTNEQRLIERACSLSNAEIIVQLGDWLPVTAVLQQQSAHNGTIAIHDWADLPQTDAIKNDSVELLIIPHTHEYTGTLNQLLNTAARVLVPDGFICILGFRQRSNWIKHLDWTGQAENEEHIVQQLQLRGLRLVEQQRYLYKHVKNTRLSPLIKPLELAAPLLWPKAAGAYMMMAQKQCVPLGSKPVWTDSQLTPGTDLEAARRVAKSKLIND